jgi:imidazolonepropionase-like amidohydrolase
LGKQTIQAGWFIDGTSATATENMRLTLEGGNIVSIDPVIEKMGLITREGRMLSVDHAIPEAPDTDNRCLDLSDYTLFPALYDCHTHMTIPGVFDPAKRNTNGILEYKTSSETISGHIEAYLKHGILSVRDGGDRNGFVLRYKQNYLKRSRIPFGLYTPGPAWYREGRYGKFIGKGVPAGKDPIPDMESWISKGIDHIKILQSGINSLSTFGKQTESQFTKDDISNIFRLCRSRGMGVMVHANGEKPVRIAIDGGCDSIEHGFFMGKDNLKKMADKRITWVPTAVAMKAYAEHAPVDSVEANVARRTLDHQMEQLVSARRYGVPVALGTDAGSPGVYHGKAVGEELGLFVSAGYTIEEAIACTTTNAAMLLKSEMPGSLQPGNPASFVAVKGKPSQIPELLSETGVIMVSGEMVKTNLTQSR